MSQIRNNNPDPVPVGNSRLPKTEPPAPELAGAGSQTLSQYGPSYNANCADCGVTGILLYAIYDDAALIEIIVRLAKVAAYVSEEPEQVRQRIHDAMARDNYLGGMELVIAP